MCISTQVVSEEDNDVTDELQKQRDEFKDEIHRLHTELIRFKKQCQKEVGPTRCSIHVIVESRQNFIR